VSKTAFRGWLSHQPPLEVAEKYVGRHVQKSTDPSAMKYNHPNVLVFKAIPSITDKDFHKGDSCSIIAFFIVVVIVIVVVVVVARSRAGGGLLDGCIQLNKYTADCFVNMDKESLGFSHEMKKVMGKRKRRNGNVPARNLSRSSRTKSESLSGSSSNDRSDSDKREREREKELQ
jgi:hypothetical protein